MAAFDLLLHNGSPSSVMNEPSRRVVLQRWSAGVVVACLLPLALYCSAGGAALLGRTFPGFFVAENRQLPSAGRFQWTGLEAGVPFHGRVVAIDGTPVTHSAEVYARAAALPPGTPLRYVFEKYGQRTELTVPTMPFAPLDYWSTAGLLTVNGWLYLVAAALVFFLQPRTRAAGVFFVMGMNLTVYAFTAITLYHPLGRWVTVLHFTAQALFPATVVHLAATFPVERRLIVDHPRLLAVPYTLAVILAVASVAGFYGEPPDLRPLYAVNLFIALALVILCTTTIYAYRERRSERVRYQARIVGLGLVAATAVAVFAFIDNAAGGGRFPMNFIAVTPVLFFAALGYAAVRHELFDIDRLVRYAVEYAVMTVLITLAYAGALVGTERLAGTAFRESSFVFVVFVVTVAFAFDPLRRRVQVLIDRTFFRNRPDHRRTLRDVSDALVTIVDLPAVVARVGWSLATAVVTERVAIGFWPDDAPAVGWSSDPAAFASEPSPTLRARMRSDPRPLDREHLAAATRPAEVALGAEMDRLGAVLVLPLVLSGGALGYVALGPKRSGRPYEHDDLELLGTMTNQAGIAMQNASSYQLLQTVNRRLEGKVRARTVELQASHDELEAAYVRLQEAQGQLIQSEKMASLGQLVAGVAHELNNPLTFIVGNVAPLREQLAAIRLLATCASDGRTLAICDDMAQILGVIASGAERTATIVKDLRTFSRVEEGTTSVVDLREGLRITINLLRPRWKDRVVIHSAIDAMPRVECDAGQVNQVFMNVLSNACDAIATTGNVWIHATSDSETVAVAIRDDGAGIAPADLPRIFDPFFTTKQIGQGTGLGLAIAHGIVQKHGGRVAVTSEVGVGTEIVVHLPIRERRRSVA
jgi:signal transduction histidine kinase